jgi:hypothetical protein
MAQSVRFSNVGGRRSGNVPHLAAGGARPVAHPALRGDPDEFGGHAHGVIRVDLLQHRTEMHDGSIAPVGWQTAQVDFPGPVRNRLHAEIGAIFVDEGRGNIGILHDDAHAIRKGFERGDLHAGDFRTEDAPREDADLRTELRRRQGRIERRAPEDHAAIRLEIGRDVPDHQVVRRAGKLGATQGSREGFAVAGLLPGTRRLGGRFRRGGVPGTIIGHCECSSEK